jgi:hypothetical protein
MCVFIPRVRSCQRGSPRLTPTQVGYAFVNFTSLKALHKFHSKRVGQKWNMFSSEKVLQVSFRKPVSPRSGSQLTDRFAGQIYSVLAHSYRLADGVLH